MYKLITIDVSSDTPIGLGEKQYKVHPRIGEWVGIEVSSVGTMFEVVMIAHSDSGDGSDVYIKKIGNSSQAVKGICNK